jgi:hypothetical protein
VNGSNHTGHSDRTWDAKAAWRWVILFVANLPMPWYLSRLFFGTQLVTDRTAFDSGVATGCLMQLAIGFYFTGRSYDIARRVTEGGVILALAQFLPIAQFTAGLAGVALGMGWFKLWGEPDALLRFLQGCTMTCVTGGCLMTAAVGLSCLFPDPMGWNSAVRSWKR